MLKQLRFGVKLNKTSGKYFKFSKRKNKCLGMYSMTSSLRWHDT